jgi:hypothetical protein
MNLPFSAASMQQWLAGPLPQDVALSLDRLARTDDVRYMAVMPDVHLSHDGMNRGSILRSTVFASLPRNAEPLDAGDPNAHRFKRSQSAHEADVDDVARRELPDLLVKFNVDDALSGRHFLKVLDLHAAPQAQPIQDQ